MATAIGSILRQATRKKGDCLNIITFPTHEPYEVMLCRTGNSFWAVRTPEVRDWNKNCRDLPSNYTLLNPTRGEGQIPLDIDFDLVLSNNKAGQFQLAQQISKNLLIPHVNMEHTLPHPNWPSQQVKQWSSLRADANLFISEYNREQWEVNEEDAVVIHHGIDSELFSPNERIVKRKPIILTCVNDFINRDWCCGYNIWRRVTNGLPNKVRGNTPDLSEGTRNIHELITELRQSAIYFNTSTYSPVPMAVLEAMACGCAIVTTATCMMPEIIRHGENGFITNNEKRLREYLEFLLNCPEECRRLGKMARQTIIEKFSTVRFINQWKTVFDKVIGKAIY